MYITHALVCSDIFAIAAAIIAARPKRRTPRGLLRWPVPECRFARPTPTPCPPPRASPRRPPPLRPRISCRPPRTVPCAVLGTPSVVPNAVIWPAPPCAASPVACVKIK